MVVISGRAVVTTYEMDGIGVNHRETADGHAVVRRWSYEKPRNISRRPANVDSNKDCTLNRSDSG